MTPLIAVVKAEFPDCQQKMAVSSHFSSLVHKRRGNIKSPRSLFSTGFVGFCMCGGQGVVKIDDDFDEVDSRRQVDLF